MNITIPKSALLPCLDRANGIADKKSPVPAIANVLLRAHAGKLSVMATDLYMAMSVDLDATIDEPGVIALPAKDLYERIRAMPDGPIQIRKMLGNEGAISALVKAVGAARKYTVAGLDATDYPLLPTPEPGASWQTFPAGALRHLLDCVHLAISQDETRPHVNSALLVGDGHALTAVATDGHRLTKAVAAVKVTLADTLVPLKAVGEIRRLLDKQSGEVDMHVTRTVLFLRLGPLTWSTKTVDHAFPPYEQVIPQRPANTCRVSRTGLIDALKATQISANERTGGVSLVFATNKVTARAESAETGTAEDEISADYGGPETTIGFNAKYVLDALGALDCDEVDLGLDGDLDPIVVRSTTTPDDFLGVLMPMRI